jgi:hypothetical protein
VVSAEGIECNRKRSLNDLRGICGSEKYLKTTGDHAYCSLTVPSFEQLGVNFPARMATRRTPEKGDRSNVSEIILTFVRKEGIRSRFSSVIWLGSHLASAASLRD